MGGTSTAQDGDQAAAGGGSSKRRKGGAAAGVSAAMLARCPKSWPMHVTGHELELRQDFRWGWCGGNCGLARAPAQCCVCFVARFVLQASRGLW
jgi:hypothetical protein